jgi:cell volume regulation protein A
MESGPEVLMALAAALVLAGVLASKLSARSGIPALLLFLALGMLAGSDGFGGIAFSNYEVAQAVGIVALAFILFDGGLSTDWASVRPVVREGVVLATAGVAVTAVVVGWAASLALGLPLTVGLLLGAIVSSTDAAAVFSVLRSRNASIKGDTGPLLELESGSNDPMAVFLTVGLLQLLEDPGTPVATLVPLFVLQMTVGAAVGVVVAWAAVTLINRVRLEYDGLYPVVTVAVVLLAYGSAALLGGSGFLAVYVAGLRMGNSDFVHKRRLVGFHDAIAWLSQISMFLVLGLLVFPSRLPDIAARGLAVAAVLVLVARPLAVFVTLARSRLGKREKLLVSWVGLRGAVPIILATFPLVEGVAQAETIFDVVFFAVVVSVLVQGTTIPAVARRLGVSAPLAPHRAYPIEAVSTSTGNTSMHEVTVGAASPAAGRQVVDLGLPQGALLVLLSRDDEFVVPQGATLLRPGDKVLVLADSESLRRTKQIVEGNGSGL